MRSARKPSLLSRETSPWICGACTPAAAPPRNWAWSAEGIEPPQIACPTIGHRFEGNCSNHLTTLERGACSVA